MGIGKGKSDKIDIDGLIEGVGNENKVAQEESKLEQKIKELKDVRLELEAATRKMEEVTFALKTATDSADNIISGICRANFGVQFYHSNFEYVHSKLVLNFY